MKIRIPFCIPLFMMNECHPLEIPALQLTVLFGRWSTEKWIEYVLRNPEDCSARWALARRLQAEKHYEQAIDNYKKLLAYCAHGNENSEHTQYDPDLEANVRYHIGEVLLAQDKLSEARHEWETVLTLSSKVKQRSARRSLLDHPADGSTPPHRYLLVIVHKERIVEKHLYTELDVAQSAYATRKREVAEQRILGVGLADYFPNGTYSIWMELPRPRSERKIIRQIISINVQAGSTTLGSDGNVPMN